VRCWLPDSAALIFLCLLLCGLALDAAAADKPAKVFILAGQSNMEARGAMLTIQQAQLAMNDVPEFAGNVKAIRTDVLVDKAAEEFYPGWEKNQEQWKLVGGDHPYHYFGSAIWFTRIGHAMAEAMTELIPAE
jgi:alpha-galactosidase